VARKRNVHTTIRIRSALAVPIQRDREEHMKVMIGVDPHKTSHNAVAIGDNEDELGNVKVRATSRQLAQLLTLAEPFEKRTWAIESAGGLGYLLAQQLVAAGEEVVDVPATLASRVRVLAFLRRRSISPSAGTDRGGRSPRLRSGRGVLPRRALVSLTSNP
jgi:hypothetical protein